MIRNPDFHARNGYILAVHPSDTTLPREFREQCREYGVGDLLGREKKNAPFKTKGTASHPSF
jgi:hypothetical protein